MIRSIQLLIILLFVSLPLFSQSVKSLVIEGKVVDRSSNEPVPFASVGIRDYPFGTSSNTEGLFSLRIPAALAEREFILTVSCVGFETFERKSPPDSLTVFLNPSEVQLKEVLVLSKDLRPEKIVQRAFSNIRKNYNLKPFVYKSFYRHYCKDDSAYGRLIEGAVDIYKRKGYQSQQPSPGLKEEVQVTQLRRSFDNTKIKDGHLPIALYSVMGADPVSYQAKRTKGTFLDFFNRYEVSSLKRNLKVYEFSLDGITEYDGKEVYIIRYSLRLDSVTAKTGIVIHNKQDGVLYITTKGYAIVKSEWSRYTALDTIHSIAIYKKYNDKYYLQHVVKEGRTYNHRLKQSHNYHVELMTSDIVLKDYTPFKGKEPDREALLRINYDSTFWNHYNVIKATPLEEKIVADLQKEKSLENQYADYLQVERERYFGGKEDEEKFLSLLEVARGNRPVYIDLWASWCGPCIKEMKYSKELFERYRSVVAFVYLSIDSDIDAWRTAVKQFGLQARGMHHFRVGPHGDVVKMFEVDTIPRYILVDKKGNFVDMNAKRPSDHSLKEDLERLIAEQVDK